MIVKTTSGYKPLILSLTFLPMTNKNENLSMKDRLDKARLKQQVKQEEIDLIDELTSLVPDSMVQIIPNDEETIQRQV